MKVTWWGGWPWRWRFYYVARSRYGPFGELLVGPVGFTWPARRGEAMRDWHVLPLNDLIEHEESDECPCGPDVTFVSGGMVVTHHSLDGREKYERPQREDGGWQVVRARH